jgi:hypothetical protein
MDVARRYGFMAPVMEERTGKKHCRNFTDMEGWKKHTRCKPIASGTFSTTNPIDTGEGIEPGPPW